METSGKPLKGLRVTYTCARAATIDQVNKVIVKIIKFSAAPSNAPSKVTMTTVKVPKGSPIPKPPPPHTTTPTTTAATGQTSEFKY